MRTAISCLIMSVALAAGAAAVTNTRAHDDDIVWPTYTLVSKSYDRTLSCTKLQAEIHHVDSDIKMLIKARLLAEQAWRSAQGTQSSMGREQGGAFLNTGTAKHSFLYVEAREQIKESQRIAQLRRDHLNELVPHCKPAPGTP